MRTVDDIAHRVRAGAVHGVHRVRGRHRQCADTECTRHHRCDGHRPERHSVMRRVRVRRLLQQRRHAQVHGRTERGRQRRRVRAELRHPCKARRVEPLRRRTNSRSHVAGGLRALQHVELDQHHFDGRLLRHLRRRGKYHLLDADEYWVKFPEFAHCDASKATVKCTVPKP